MKTFSTKKALSLSIALIMIISIIAACLVFTTGAAISDDTKYSIDNLGYAHAFKVSLVAGDGLKVSEITLKGVDGDGNALTAAKDMNYAAVIIVDENGYVAGIDTALSVAKSDLICPVGGYMISYNYNVTGALVGGAPAAFLTNIRLGDKINLFNVDLTKMPDTGILALTDASFSVTKYEDLVEEGYTRVNGDTGNIQNNFRTTSYSGASFDYKVYKDSDNLYFDIIVYEGLEYSSFSTDQVGASNIRFWFNGKDDASRGLIDFFYYEDEFIVKRILNDGSSTFTAVNYQTEESYLADTNGIGINLVSSSADKYNLVLSFPIASFAAGDADTFAYGLTYSSPSLLDGQVYGALHGFDTTVENWSANSNGYNKVKYMHIPGADGDVYISTPEDAVFEIALTGPATKVKAGDTFDVKLTLADLDVDALWGLMFDLTYDKDLFEYVAPVGGYSSVITVPGTTSNWDISLIGEKADDSENPYFIFFTENTDHTIKALADFEMTFTFKALADLPYDITSNIIIESINGTVVASSVSGIGAYAAIDTASEPVEESSTEDSSSVEPGSSEEEPNSSEDASGDASSTEEPTSSEEVSGTQSEAVSSDDSANPPQTGDKGIVVFVIIAMLTVAGVIVVKKVR